MERRASSGPRACDRLVARSGAALVLALLATQALTTQAGWARQASPQAAEAFLKAGCGGCHTIPGVPGAAGRVGPDLSQIGTAAAGRKPGMSADGYLRESILQPNAFIAPECPNGACPSGVMLQSFADALAREELDTIVAYLLTLGTESQEPSVAAPSVSIPRELPAESRAPLWPGATPRAAADPAKVALGKVLFFDTRLSGNRSLACASCHQPAKAWADGLALPKGYPETAYFRNTISLLDAAGRKRLYWDGRLAGADLPSLVRDHVSEAHFMNLDGRLAAERLIQVPAYATRFREIYGTEPRYGAILDAVAAYVATLRSTPAPWDAFREGRSEALSESARRGLAIFEGEGGCTGCHAGPALTDEAFHDTGVRTSSRVLSEPLRAATFRRFLRMLGAPDYRSRTHDPGVFALTKERVDLYRFRTPSLRNVGRTAPYMHDGSLESLEEVVAFYTAGGGPDQKAGLQRLELGSPQQADLVAFLREALTSESTPVAAPEIPHYALSELPEAKPRDDPRTGDAAPGLAAGDPPPPAPLPPPKGPPDNPITPSKRELGRLLFFDARMSGDGSLSCASCHPPGTGWGAPGPLSFGYPGTVHWRNASTVLNVAYYSKLNWDGAAKSIEAQNAGAWKGAVAGNLDEVMAEERLAQIPEYVKRFREVFGTTNPRFEDALRAVATYQRTLVSRNVPADAYFAGDEDAISEEAHRGLELFQGKADCIACHNGPLLSDQRFYALGVPTHEDFATNPLRQITFRWETWVKGSDETTYRTAHEDLGLYFVTKQSQDKGKFRTPGLRDLCYTGPYMHNGVLETLDDVVRFYDDGGGPHPNKDARVRPLGLSGEERGDLVAFLESLCGDRVVDDPPELPPYAPGLAEGKEIR